MNVQNKITAAEFTFIIAVVLIVSLATVAMLFVGSSVASDHISWVPNLVDYAHNQPELEIFYPEDTATI